jgi:flagella basal body P-ring formation protein FlgA
MIWSGDLALIAAFLGGPLPDGLAERVRDAIARGWNVESRVVRLQWGTMPIRARLDESMAFRVVGRGADGRYVVLVTTDRGELAVSLRAGVEDSTWVTSRPLAVNTRVGAADVRRELRLTWGRDSTADAAAPIGWETRRSLRAGEILDPSAVAPPPSVAAGETVRFEWTAGAIAIEREGVAANRARIGETVWARDPATGERLRGTVIGRARARLSRGG